MPYRRPTLKLRGRSYGYFLSSRFFPLGPRAEPLKGISSDFPFLGTYILSKRKSSLDVPRASSVVTLMTQLPETHPTTCLSEQPLRGSARGTKKAQKRQVFPEPQRSRISLFSLYYSLDSTTRTLPIPRNPEIAFCLIWKPRTTPPNFSPKHLKKCPFR